MGDRKRSRHGKNSRRKRRIDPRKVVGLVAILVVLCAIIAGSISLYFRSFVNKYDVDCVLPGIYLGEQDIGGMTAEEVYALIDADVSEKGAASITLITTEPEETETKVAMSDFGFEASNREAIVTEVIAYGKDGGTLARYNVIKSLEKEFIVYELEYDIDTDTIGVFVEENYGEMQTEAVNASLSMVDGSLTVEGGDIGVVIDTDATTEALMSFIENSEVGASGTINVPSITVEPEITAEQLERVDDVLGTYTTEASTSTDRYKNLQRGMELLDGITLLPGESLSVQETTSPYTADNGYYKAGAYSNGTVVESYAGGICQVCTTVYNAVLMAELELNQRSAHSMTVSYVDPGRDAAIAGDYKDLVFTNDTDNVIYIDTSIYSGVLKVTIYGEDTRADNRTIKYTTVTTGQTVTADPTFNAESSSSIGTKSRTSSGYTGMTVELWKYVYVDGVEESSTKINTSTYQASGAVYSVGTKSDYSEATAIMTAAIATQDEDKIDAAIVEAKALIATKEAEANAEANANTTETPETTSPETTETPEEEEDTTIETEDTTTE